MTNVPASLPERLADAEGELPEEIVKAIEVFDKVVSGRTKLHQRAGGPTRDYDIADAAYDTARDALTAAILARLTAAESARDERERFWRTYTLARLGIAAHVQRATRAKLAAAESAREAAVARAEKLEKALEPFAEAADNLELLAKQDGSPPAVYKAVFWHSALVAARAALAPPATAEET